MHKGSEKGHRKKGDKRKKGKEKRSEEGEQGGQSE